MGWICLSSKPSCDDAGGVWNSQGVAYMDISSELIAIHDKMFEWLMTISPMTYIIFFAFILIGIVMLVFLSVRRAMQNV
jgi:hypothetical protein